MLMISAGATAQDATTSAIFISNSQRPSLVENTLDEYCWVYTRDISTLGNAVEVATTITFDLTEMPRDAT